MLDLKNDRICCYQLRFDTHCFENLCNVLQINGGLNTTRYVMVKKIVAMFLHILAHDLKNRVAQGIFAPSEETMSLQFHIVLDVVLKLGNNYIKPVIHNTDCSEDIKWRYFRGVVGGWSP